MVMVMVMPMMMMMMVRVLMMELGAGGVGIGRKIDKNRGQECEQDKFFHFSGFSNCRKHGWNGTACK